MLPGLDRTEPRQLRRASASQCPDDLVHDAIHLIRRIFRSHTLPASFTIGQFCLLHTTRDYHKAVRLNM
jgi:hypothetical protein